jgi:hypothetical protein
VVLVSLGLASLGACRPSSVSNAAPTSQATQPWVETIQTRAAPAVATEAPSAKAASFPISEDPELQRLAAAISRHRGGEALRAPCLIKLPREALVRAALADLEDAAPPSLREARNEVLKRLELVPSDFDWFDAVRRSLEASLLGFYAAERRCIFLDARLSGATRRRTLAHELGHALQAQRFGFDRHLAYTDGGWDQRAAARALAEAHAETLLNDLPEFAGVAVMSDAPAPENAELPGVLVRSSIASYSDGRARVEGALAAGGWGEVDRLLSHPPESTHALLHPGDTTPAIELSPPPPPEAGIPLRHADVLGEQALRIVLEEWVPRATAERLASGWRGDRWSLFEGAGGVAASWQLQVATPQAARDTAAAFRSGLRLPPVAARSGALSCRRHRDQGVIALASRGPALAFLSLRRGNASTCADLQAWAQRWPDSKSGLGNPGPR